MSQTLAERIAAVRKVAAEADNTSITSELRTPTSLETYVRIYNKCNSLTSQGLEGSCYVNYMEGAKLLHTYLSPIVVPTDVVFNSVLRPDLISGYAVSEVANIISGKTYGSEHNYIHNLVVYYTAKHILEEVVT